MLRLKVYLGAPVWARHTRRNRVAGKCKTVFFDVALQPVKNYL